MIVEKTKTKKGQEFIGFHVDVWGFQSESD